MSYSIDRKVAHKISIIMLFMTSSFFLLYLYFIFIFYFLAVPLSLWDLSSPEQGLNLYPLQ